MMEKLIKDSESRNSSQTENEVYGFIWWSSLVLHVLIFSIYIQVYRINRADDKNSAVFPIINHLYNSVRIVHVLYFVHKIFVALFFILLITYQNLHVIVANVGLLLLWTLQETCSVAAQVNLLMLSLLSIQRFSIYFWPSTEKYVTFKERTINWFHFISHLVFLPLRLFMKYRMMIYIPLNILLFISVFLYIPIIYSILKVRHLASIQANKPHRYVIWQLFSIGLIKFIYTGFFMNIASGMSIDNFNICESLDMVVVPLVIETCYLGCNRRVMSSFFQLPKFGNYWKVCCCPCIETKSRVEQCAEQPADLEMVVTTGPLPSLPPRRPAAA